MMKPELYRRIALTRNVLEDNLKRGDLAWVIEYIEHPEGGEEGAILEIFNALGESLCIATVPVSAIAALRPDQVPSVRELAIAG